MQGEALLKIGSILEKLSNDINILKKQSIPKRSRKILRSTSQRRRSNKKISMRKSSHKKNTRRKR